MFNLIMKVTLISFAPNFALVTTSKVCADSSRPFPSFVFRAYILSRRVIRVVDVVEGNIVAAATGCLAMVDVDKHDRRFAITGI